MCWTRIRCVANGGIGHQVRSVREYIEQVVSVRQHCMILRFEGLDIGLTLHRNVLHITTVYERLVYLIQDLSLCFFLLSTSP